MRRVKLDAFNGRDLQHAAQIMQMCIDTGLDLPECLKASQNKTVVPRSEVCGCGAKMTPGCPVEKLNRLVCRDCGYSEVIK